jgi:DNA invertase Pin-like site-specific DNA recombinase
VRVALYARVSTRDKGQEVENQLMQLREFTTKQGWTISCEYVDRESGAKSDRAEFQQMFRDAAQHRFDLLLFWSLDRFSREGVLETLTHLNRLTAAGLGYRSFTEPYFDSCGIFKDAVISILATIAKQERIRLSERVRAGLDRARSRGKRLGRPRTLLDVAKIGRLRSQGRSWRRIARQMECSAKTCRRAWQKYTSEGFCPAADEKEKTPMPAAPQASEYTEARL